MRFGRNSFSLVLCLSSCRLFYSLFILIYRQLLIFRRDLFARPAIDNNRFRSAQFHHLHRCVDFYIQNLPHWTPLFGKKPTRLSPRIHFRIWVGKYMPHRLGSSTRPLNSCWRAFVPYEKHSRIWTEQIPEPSRLAVIPICSNQNPGDRRWR